MCAGVCRVFSVPRELPIKTYRSIKRWHALAHTSKTHFSCYQFFHHHKSSQAFLSATGIMFDRLGFSFSSHKGDSLDLPNFPGSCSRM